MSFTVVIPARFASSRLPGKMLADIAGKPLVARTVAQANQSSATRVIVATDDERIAAALETEPCEVCMTRVDHQSGSDRIAEVVQKLSIDADEVVVNVQGDEPIIPPALIDAVAQVLIARPSLKVSTAAHPITAQQDIDDPNVVKVVINQLGRAMYFSRSAMPFDRTAGKVRSALKHVGIYAYRAGFLNEYQALAASDLEQLECLEQLRILDAGIAIGTVTVDYDTGIGVDTQADLDRVRGVVTPLKFDGKWSC